MGGDDNMKNTDSMTADTVIHSNYVFVFYQQK